MKKFLLAVLGVAVIFSGCGNKKQDTEVNYFNGAGSLKSDSGRYATSVIYDDNTYYLKTSRGYVYTDKDKCYSICLDATCSHSGTGCIADENNNYFMLHGDLYSANGDIKKCDTGDVVYKDVKPDKYNTEEYSTYATDIDEVAVYNDKYMILKEKGYKNILNDKFESVYAHDYGYKCETIIGDNYYLLTEKNKVMCINLLDGTESITEVDAYILAIVCTEDYLYYVDRFDDLYKKSWNEDESVRIMENVSDICATDKYIYAACMNMDDGTYHTIIMDTEGNSIKDLENIYVTFIDYADGKIFFSGIDIENAFIQIVQMDENGDNIIKYSVDI